MKKFKQLNSLGVACQCPRLPPTSHAVLGLLGLILFAPACQDVAEISTVEAPASVAAPPARAGLAAAPAVGELPVCAPTAIAYLPPPIALPAGALDGNCALQSVSVDSNADGKADVVTKYDHGEGTVTVAQNAVYGSDGAQTVYTVDKHGQVTGVQQVQPDGKISYKETREFDGDGHLLVHETSSVVGYGSKGQNLQVYRISQKWQHGNQISWSDWNSTSGQNATMQWTYDSNGRMTQASRSNGPKGTIVAQADWSYDSNGRPVSLQRRANGKVSMLASWRWGNGNHLQARSIQVNLVGGYSGSKLDSYDAPTGSMGAGNCYGCGGFGGSSNVAAPWADAMPAATATCQPVATAVGHGYPESDYALDGPWSDAAQQDEDGFASNYYGYGYGYGYGGYGYGGYGGYGGGGASWYGHSGAGSNWDGLAVAVAHTSARFDMEYDGLGRMTLERLEVTPTDPKSTVPRQLLRQRQFDSRGLTNDAVLLPTTGQELRSLRFQRHHDGRLVRRELRVVTQVAESDDFTFDAQGRAVAHVHLAQKEPWKVLAPTALAADTLIALPTEQTRWTRSFADAHKVAAEQVFAAGAAEPTYQRFNAYNAKAQLVARAIVSGGQQTNESWNFDEAGRETLHATTTPHSQYANNWYIAHTYNAKGLLVLTEQGVEPAKGATWQETSSYACH